MHSVMHFGAGAAVRSACASGRPTLHQHYMACHKRHKSHNAAPQIHHGTHPVTHTHLWCSTGETLRLDMLLANSAHSLQAKEVFPGSRTYDVYDSSASSGGAWLSQELPTWYMPRACDFPFLSHLNPPELRPEHSGPPPVITVQVRHYVVYCLAAMYRGWEPGCEHCEHATRCVCVFPAHYYARNPVCVQAWVHPSVSVSRCIIKVQICHSFN